MSSKVQKPSIEVFHLTKRYLGTSRFAVKDLNLEVFPGEVYGFLGPNGAGKSTTIKMLMGFLLPTAGTANIKNLNITKDSVKVKEHVGYLAGDISMYQKMTGIQLFSYLREFQPSVNQGYFDSLVERLNADLHKKIKELSRGNRQKLAIIQAFMGQPDVLILDEPTTGLDPLMQEVFFELVEEAKERKATVFISSHILSEVQKICDRVGIIREGKLVEEYSMEQLSKQVAQTFEIRFLGTAPISELEAINGLKILQQKERFVSVHIPQSMKPLFKVLSRHEVRSINSKNVDLEDIFMHFYKNNPGDKQ